MIADQDLDLAIGSWVRAANTGPAPKESLRSAFEELDRTAQRQWWFVGPISVPVWRAPARRPTRPRVVLAVMLLSLTAVTVVVGAGAINRLLNGPLPSPSVPTPSDAAPAVTPKPSSPFDAGDRRFDFRDEGIQVTVPATWSRVGGPANVVLLVGPDGTTTSIYHGESDQVSLCDPRCETIALAAARLPYDAARARADAMEALHRRIGDADPGGATWEPVGDPNSTLVGAEILAVTRPALSAQQAFVVASYINGLIVVAVTTPIERDARALIRQIVASLRPYPAFVAQVGAPVLHTGLVQGIEVEIPDVWQADTTPPAPGVMSFGGRAVTISVASADGSMAVCDPTCRTVVARDLAELEAATFSAPGPSVRTGDVTLSAYAGRYQVNSGASPSYRAIGVVDGWAVHIWVALPADEVDRSVADAIAASFEFLPVATRLVDGRLVGNGFELPLDPAWKGFSISVSSGDAFNRYWMCTFSGWSTTTVTCRIVVGETLDQMAAAIDVGTKRTDAILDGEPAVVIRAEYYEYPARGAQWGAFIVAIHDGRPFYIRIQSGTTAGLPVAEVLAAFRFTD